MSALAIRPAYGGAPLFAYYDRVAVVNLAERTDRRKRVANELASLGCPEWELFEAFRTETSGPFLKVGSHGAYLSHLALLESAAATKKSILILQDDCTFLPDITWVEPAHGTDIFYGGYSAYSAPQDPAASNIIGAHCMGFSARAASMASAYLRQRLETEDDIPPIDGCLVDFRRQMSTFIKTEFKLVSMQYSSASDVSPGKLDRVPYVSNVLRPLRWLKTVGRKHMMA